MVSLTFSDVICAGRPGPPLWLDPWVVTRETNPLSGTEPFPHWKNIVGLLKSFCLFMSCCCGQVLKYLPPRLLSSREGLVKLRR